MHLFCCGLSVHTMLGFYMGVRDTSSRSYTCMAGILPTALFLQLSYNNYCYIFLRMLMGFTVPCLFKSIIYSDYIHPVPNFSAACSYLSSSFTILVFTFMLFLYLYVILFKI